VTASSGLEWQQDAEVNVSHAAASSSAGRTAQ